MKTYKIKAAQKDLSSLMIATMMGDPEKANEIKAIQKKMGMTQNIANPPITPQPLSGSIRMKLLEMRSILRDAGKVYTDGRDEIRDAYWSKDKKGAWKKRKVEEGGVEKSLPVYKKGKNKEDLAEELREWADKERTLELPLLSEEEFMEIEAVNEGPIYITASKHNPFWVSGGEKAKVNSEKPCSECDDKTNNE